VEGKLIEFNLLYGSRDIGHQTGKAGLHFSCRGARKSIEMFIKVIPFFRSDI
jgi:hypothetical protein